MKGTTTGVSGHVGTSYGVAVLLVSSSEAATVGGPNKRNGGTPILFRGFYRVGEARRLSVDQGKLSGKQSGQAPGDPGTLQAIHPKTFPRVRVHLQRPHQRRGGLNHLNPTWMLGGLGCRWILLPHCPKGDVSTLVGKWGAQFNGSHPKQTYARSPGLFCRGKQSKKEDGEPWLQVG